MVSSLPGRRYITLHKYSWLPTPDSLVSKHAATFNITDDRKLINFIGRDPWIDMLKLKVNYIACPQQCRAS